jgi:hypothetical protein
MTDPAAAAARIGAASRCSETPVARNAVSSLFFERMPRQTSVAMSATNGVTCMPIERRKQR